MELAENSAVEDKIKMVVGNGESTSLWLDHWHQVDPLYLLTNQDVYPCFDLDLKARVRNIVLDAAWTWPEGEFWSRIHEATPPNFNSRMNRADSPIWLPSLTVSSLSPTLCIPFPLHNRSLFGTTFYGVLAPFQDSLLFLSSIPPHFVPHCIK